MEKVIVRVDPGVCGFECIIKAGPAGKKSVAIEILECDCTMIQDMSRSLPELSLNDLFIPLTRHPVMAAGEKAKCHLACPVPVAIFKAAEVALGMAVPKDVTLKIEKEE
ncbi:DUF6951 family protein [Desulfospira joergensenii]|uniref:DUF6951 family protein n=1 Tax=Desulfospira joergensenii TaxID=53329 RepID=UPI0003B5AC81|nr:hypothetical protein [Desulfospira joergensenii]